MAITDPAAIKYANEQFRPAADKIARCKYRSEELSAAWAALQGTNDDRFAQLQLQIQRVANLVTNTWRFVFWADRLWQSGSLHLLFPNDPLEELHDNADATGPDPNRPTVTGEDLRRLKNRMEEFANWLARGTDLDLQFDNDALATEPLTYGFFDDFARMAEDGAKAQTTGWGREVAVDRCGELVTEYETTNPGKFNHILRAAVNATPLEE